MLENLTGQLTKCGDNYIIIELGGMGLKVISTRNTLAKLKRDHPKLPSQCSLLTYLHIQENKWEIFGFSEEQEREAFLLLLTCRGVGAKASQNILNSLTPARLKRIALGEEPVTTLQQVPGIGAKSAGRILVELKEKLPEMGSWEDETTGKNKNILEYTHEDLFNALKNLGYRTTEIQMAISNSPTLPNTLSEAVKHLLRILGKG